jgi:hypothetical protein
MREIYVYAYGENFGPKLAREKGVDVRIILKFILTETHCEDVNWIQLARDKVQWRTSMNTVMKIQLYKAENFLTI